MEMFLYILYGIIAIGALWIFYLTCDKICPKCGTKLDRAGNDYHCRNCRILYHMNLFGKLKKKIKL